MMANTNYVGSVVPAEQDVEKLVNAVQGCVEEMGLWGQILASDQRPRMLKFRLGGEKQIALVAELAREKKLQIDTYPIDGMLADLKIGEAAERIEKKVEALQQLVADTRLAGQSEAWQAFLGYYAMLSSMAARDPDLAARLRPVVDFMSTGRKPKPQAK